MSGPNVSIETVFFDLFLFPCFTGRAPDLHGRRTPHGLQSPVLHGKYAISSPLLHDLASKEVLSHDAGTSNQAPVRTLLSESTADQDLSDTIN